MIASDISWESSSSQHIEALLPFGGKFDVQIVKAKLPISTIIVQIGEHFQPFQSFPLFFAELFDLNMQYVMVPERKVHLPMEYRLVGISLQIQRGMRKWNIEWLDFHAVQREERLQTKHGGGLCIDMNSRYIAMRGRVQVYNIIPTGLIARSIEAVRRGHRAVNIMR